MSARMIALALAFASVVASAAAQQPADSTRLAGLVHGHGAAFWIDAPAGWTLDRDAGRADDLVAVLYRTGETWQTSEPVMFINVSAIDEGDSLGVARVIAADVARWKKQAPDVKVTRADTVRTANGQRLTVRMFKSAKAKHQEAAAYVLAGDRVWILVLAAKSKDAFTSTYPDFLSLVRSYRPGPDVTEP